MAHNWNRCGISLAVVAMIGLSPGCWASLTGSYMVASADSLLYLRITEVGGKINGYMQIVESDLSKPQAYAARQLHVTGEASEASFSLHGDNYDKFWGGGIPECEGTRKAGRLLLHFPTNDGRMASYTFKPTSVVEWNSAVSSFQKRQQVLAYVQKWSDALWNRQEQMNNDLEEAQRQADGSRLRLSEHQALLEKKRSAVTEAEGKVTKSKDDLKVAKDSLSAAEEATRRAEADAERENTSDAREKARDVGDSENKARDSVSSAESNVSDAGYDLRNAQGDMKDAQEEVAKDSAEIAAAVVRVEEDTVELNHYLFGHVIYGMLDELDKGFVLGTAVRDTEIREHPCSTSDVLYTVSLDKEVPILTCGWDFRPVLLDDGKSLGWIPAKDIRVTVHPYQASKDSKPAKAAKRGREPHPSPLLRGEGAR